MTAPRKRFRLSLRGLMLINVAFAAWLGWRVHLARQQREAIKAVRQLDGQVLFDFEKVKGGFTTGVEPPGPRWLRRLIGDEFFQCIYHVDFEESENRSCEDALATLSTQHSLRSLDLSCKQATDEGLSHVAKLTGLKRLYLHSPSQVSESGFACLGSLADLELLYVSDWPKATDAGLHSLSRLTMLESLEIRGDAFSDQGLSALSGMKRLKKLTIGGRGPKRTRISDDGLALIAGLGSLEYLRLDYVNVTDEGMKHIPRLTKLRALVLNGCRVTDVGVSYLSEARGLCECRFYEEAVTEDGLKRLRERSPNLKATRYNPWPPPY